MYSFRPRLCALRLPLPSPWRGVAGVGWRGGRAWLGVGVWGVARRGWLAGAAGVVRVCRGLVDCPWWIS